MSLFNLFLVSVGVLGRSSFRFFLCHVGFAVPFLFMFRGRFFSGKVCFWYRCLICFWCRLRCWVVCHVGLVPVMWALRFGVFSCISVVLFMGGFVFGIVACAFVVFGFVVAKGGSIIVQCVSLVFKTHSAGR